MLPKTNFGEIQVHRIGKEKESFDDVDGSKNSNKMLEEFGKKIELNDDEKWHFDIKEHIDSFFQMQFKISPYLNKDSLIEINHSLITQFNECLNRSVSAVAPKDRCYNGNKVSLGG